MEFVSLLPLDFLLRVTQMPARVMILMIGDPHQVFVFFLEGTRSHGVLRNNKEPCSCYSRGHLVGIIIGRITSSRCREDSSLG